MKNSMQKIAIIIACILFVGNGVAQKKAIIKIDTDRIIGEINPNIYGTFIEPNSDRVYGKLYDPTSRFANEDGFRKDLIELTKELKIPVIRWPGGNYVSAYNWEDGIGPKNKRPARFESAWRSIDSNQMGTDEYVEFCKQVHAQNFVCINAGTGTLNEARHWVEYCNFEKGTYYSDLRRKYGHEEPYQIKFWALGNEIDGWWEMGQKSAEDYIKFAREAGKLMRRTDKNILLIASGGSNPNPDHRWIEWNQKVINGLVNEIDYVSTHRYTRKGNSFAQYMTAGMDLDQRIRIIKEQIDIAQVKNGKDKDLFISFDEWSPKGEDLSAMLSLAQHLNSFVRHADIVKMANFTMLTNLFGFDKKHGFYRSALTHAFSLFSNNCFGTSLDVHLSCPTYDMSSFQDVDGFKNIPYLDVTAAYQKESGEIVIYVVNRHETDNISTSIILQSGKIVNKPMVIELNGPTIHSINTYESQLIKPVKKEIEVKNNTITYSFPAHSLSMIKFKVE
jgi:alpha-N-arabinofuranosidase